MAQRYLSIALLACSWILISALPAVADTIQLPIAFDRWMYPFNSTPGTRVSGSVFGAVDEVDFDDRDAQVLLGFDTSALNGGGPMTVTGAVLKVTIATDNVFNYDPTYDDYTTYLAGGVDSDTGRPLELYGVATRNGFTNLAIGTPGANEFGETSSYGSPRNAYISDYNGGVPRDISNNIADAFNPTAWAVGQSALAPGASVPLNTEFTFTVDLNNPYANTYVQNGFNNGALFFGLSALTAAEEMNPAIPAIWLNTQTGGSILSLGQTATLELTVVNTPEPSSLVLSILAVIGLAWLLPARFAGRRRRRISR